MLLTPEQEQIGRENFNEVVGLSRRDFMKGAAPPGTGLGAYYFGYQKLEGKPVHGLYWLRRRRQHPDQRAPL